MFIGVSALLARAWSVDGAERSAITDLVEAEARGDQAGVVARIKGCDQSAGVPRADPHGRRGAEPTRQLLDSPAPDLQRVLADRQHRHCAGGVERRALRCRSCSACGCAAPAMSCTNGGSSCSSSARGSAATPTARGRSEQGPRRFSARSGPDGGPARGRGGASAQAGSPRASGGRAGARWRAPHLAAGDRRRGTSRGLRGRRG